MEKIYLVFLSNGNDYKEWVEIAFLNSIDAENWVKDYNLTLESLLNEPCPIDGCSLKISPYYQNLSYKETKAYADWSCSMYQIMSYNPPQIKEVTLHR